MHRHVREGTRAHAPHARRLRLFECALAVSPLENCLVTEGEGGGRGRRASARRGWREEGNNPTSVCSQPRQTCQHRLARGHSLRWKRGRGKRRRGEKERKRRVSRCKLDDCKSGITTRSNYYIAIPFTQLSIILLSTAAPRSSVF